MKKSNFFKSSAILFIGDLLTKILGFIYLAPLARIDEGIGTIQGFLMTPYSFFITFSVMGITNVMMYKLGPVRNDKDMYKKHFLDGSFYVLFTSTVITLFLICFAKPLMIAITPEGLPYLPELILSLRIIAISILFFALNTLIRAVLLSKNYVKIISITYITEQLIKLLILLFGCYYFITIKENPVEISSYITALSVVISVASTSIILIVYALKIKLFTFMNGQKYKMKLSSFKAIFTLGAVYFINSIFINGFSQIDLAMMSNGLSNQGYAVNEIEVITGVYFTWSWKLIMVVITLGSVFVTMMIQQMTRVDSIREKVQELKLVFDVILLYALLATVFFLTAGVEFYEMFYGTLVGIEILMVQSLLILPIIVRMQFAVFSITVGQRRIVLLSTALIFLVKIILNPILFYYFEVYGFILASIIACFCSIAFMLIFDRDIFNFTKNEYLETIKSVIKMIGLYVITLIFANYIRSFNIPTISVFILISIETLILFTLINFKTLVKFKTRT